MEVVKSSKVRNLLETHTFQKKQSQPMGLVKPCQQLLIYLPIRDKKFHGLEIRTKVPPWERNRKFLMLSRY